MKRISEKLHPGLNEKTADQSRLELELASIISSSISTKKEKILAECCLWLLRNSRLRPFEDREPVSVPPEKTETEDW